MVLAEIRTKASDIDVVRQVGRKLFLLGDDVRPIVQQPIIEQFLGDQRNQHALDAGCGRGYYTRLLLPRSAKVTALDYNQTSIQALRRRLGHLDNLSLHVGSADNLPFANEQFDLVTHCEVLEHIHDDRQVVSELFRVLQPGGRLILSVPVPPAPIDDSEHVREGYTLEQISQLLHDAGFEILRHQYCMFNISKRLIQLQSWWTQRFAVPLPAFILLPVYLERIFQPSPTPKNLPYDVVLEARKPTIAQ